MDMGNLLGRTCVTYMVPTPVWTWFTYWHMHVWTWVTYMVSNPLWTWATAWQGPALLWVTYWVPTSV